MTEATFWRSTPRKLSALAAAYNRFHAEKPETARKATAADFAAFGVLPKG